MLLSIIIPVYNLEKYIGECLDSCLKQDVDNYEIICVNDGSKDNSKAVLDKYAEMYPDKIKAFHKENGGVSSARNYGITKASGEWIWFVDGDDFIVENCLKAMSESLEEDDDFLMLDLSRPTQNSEMILNSNKLDVRKISYEDMFNISTKNSYGGGASAYWLKLNKIKELGLEFDTKMKYSEDVKFLFQYRLACPTGGRLFDNVVYYYRVRDDSAMHTVDPYHQNDCMKILMHIYNDSMKTHQEFEKELLNRRTTAVQVIQTNLLCKIRDYNLTKKEMGELKQLGFYPYKPIKIKHKTTANKKAKILNIAKKTFHKEKIFMLTCKLLSKR